MEELRQVAREALDSFVLIADAAGRQLQERGLSLDSMASVNQATADTIAREMREKNAQRAGDAMHLRHEPAIARLVLIDEDEKREVLYISRVGTVNAGVRMCSYMSPKGRLAPLPVGQGLDIPLPGGRRWFDVIEKMTFKPVLDDGWDSRPSVYHREGEVPLTIKSLRDLLIGDGFSPDEADAMAAWLAQDSDDGGHNVVEGLRRETLTAMQLRIAPILDRIQDAIFRLPLDSQIAVIGPPGTGKTTTLVRRLRQKLDFQYLDQDEQELVAEPDAAGLSHPDSWMMFTPTELLRQYVKEAFGKEGVPVHDERMRTWDDYRRDIGRGELRLLRTGSSSGLVLKDNPDLLQKDTLLNQIAWFKAFDAFQRQLFVEQMEVEARRLAEAEDQRLAVSGRRALAAIERGRDRPIQIVAELLSMADGLRTTARDLSQDIQAALDAPFSQYRREDATFGDALLQFVTNLDRDIAEETDEETDDDDDGDEVATAPLAGRRLAADMFRKAMRARAIGQASGSAPGAKTRAGRLLEFLSERGHELPDLKDIGKQLLVQRAARRLGRAPTTWIGGVSLRYRRFRRSMRRTAHWYGEAAGGALDAHPAEIDLIILAILASASEMESDTLTRNRLADQRPALLDAIAKLKRNQILVDEATDFSPIQLAIMRHLASARTQALFISGDYNQRLTMWGSRTESELLWAVPQAKIERISITYRQSRKLAEFAQELAALQGMEVVESPPENLENKGLPPVLGTSLVTPEEKANWLAARVREIEAITDGVMPTIAVLMPEEAGLEPMAAALSEALESMNIRAVACPKGMVKGQQGDVRIFDIQHIKGLEFEAVFFVDVDELANRQPAMFDRYIYVGATRAATFLGLTVAGPDLPASMAQLAEMMQADWS